MPETRNRRKASSVKRPNARPLPSLENPAGGDINAFTARQVRRLVDLPAELIRSLASAGHIHPADTDNSVSYSLQDLVLLRIASALHAVQIPARKIIEAVSQIRQALPLGSSLSVISMIPSDDAVAVRRGPRGRQSASGQYTLPSAIDTRPSSVASSKRRAALENRLIEAQEHFANALSLEDSDVAAARAGYIAALNAHSGHLEARINLGRLLHLAGELREAEKVYREAKHASALLSFNLAILLEDLSREEEAVVAYREALALDPGMHDAHYNLSRLHERAERPGEALRHLLAYRRHTTRHRD